MSRHRPRKNEGGVSLFPFLAVLICTMGSLIVLLVLVVKQAEVQAQEQRDFDVEKQGKARQELEEQEFLRQTLEATRPEVTKQLAENRLELSHLEDHIRRLKQQADQLRMQLKSIENNGSERQQDRGAAEAELANLKRQIEAARQEFEIAKRRAASQPRSFAIVPYRGPNGTSRRPIYIECTGNGVILQPEGIALQAGDFRQPLVPGNPLDAALLAIREYLARSGAIGNGRDEPYPLLIVRPRGAESYAVARAAMKSWEDEFGYELIDDKLNLKYPQPDPALEKIIRQAIDEARRRQTALARSQPSRFQRGSGGGGSTRLRAAHGGGGFVPEGGEVDDQGFFDGPDRNSSAGTNDDVAVDKPLRQQGSDAGQPGTPGPRDQDAKSQDSFGQPGNPSSFGGAQGDLTSSRGKNWGLPSKSPGATAFTRPILVRTFADRLEVIPQRGTGERPYITPLRGSTRESIDAFVGTIWKHMESWGIAARNGYWKPVLRVEVAPGGEQRFADLQLLLKGSGLDVRRK